MLTCRAFAQKVQFTEAMPRYVILEHDWPNLHWDLMLETGVVLRTWRLSAPPAIDIELNAERLADHRPMYLDYEGPVSQERGTVRRWDQGTFTWLADRDGCHQIELHGERLLGTLVIEERAKGKCAARFLASV